MRASRLRDLVVRRHLWGPHLLLHGRGNAVTRGTLPAAAPRHVEGAVLVVPQLATAAEWETQAPGALRAPEERFGRSEASGSMRCCR